jgi:transcriptional regulator with XRE-family HTH domain
LGVGPGSAFAVALGQIVKEHRRSSGLTQEQIATPATKAFISLVEHGRIVPSLPSLLLIATKLGVPARDLLSQVNARMTGEVD